MFSILIVFSFILGNFKVMATECSINMSFVCHSKGKFVDPEDRSCKKYYHCMQYFNTFEVTCLNCPTGQYFYPAKQICSHDYVCPNITTIPKTDITIRSTVGDFIVNINRPYLDCKEKQKIANLDDLTCRTYYTYYSCHSLKNGKKVKYICPKQTIFNPNSENCEPSDKRQCNNKLIQIKAAPSVVSRVGTNECTKAGEMPNLEDLTCHTYVQCTLNANGKYQKVLYVCPSRTYFNPNQGCDSFYKCPGNFVQN